jgi:hypothetical protein
VGLNVAWQYLSAAEKQSFKRQARSFLRAIHELKPPPSVTPPSYVVPDADPIEHRGIQHLEQQLLFGTITGAQGSISCCRHSGGCGNSDSGSVNEDGGDRNNASSSGGGADCSGHRSIGRDRSRSASVVGSGCGRCASGDDADNDTVDVADFGFMHNDLTPSNLIVDQGRIVAAIDWEMAGFFGWRAAREVHVQIRSPKRESYAHLQLPEELLRDICYWGDLYDVDADDTEHDG